LSAGSAAAAALCRAPVAASALPAAPAAHCQRSTVADASAPIGEPRRVRPGLGGGARRRRGGDFSLAPAPPGGAACVAVALMQRKAL